MATWTYKYALFLRNKATKECENMVIEVDADPEQDCLTVHSLVMKLARQTRMFPAGYVLISMMVIEAFEKEEALIN